MERLNITPPALFSAIRKIITPRIIKCHTNKRWVLIVIIFRPYSIDKIHWLRKLQDQVKTEVIIKPLQSLTVNPDASII